MTITLDLTTPEKLERFADRVERARKLQPEALMDFSNFVKQFQKNENKETAS